MAVAKKLPSGSWRVQASKVVNGKKISKSFTVSPTETGGSSRKAKATAEMKAREWQISKKNEDSLSRTIGKAIGDYIADHEKVLSPRTIHDYRALVKHFEKVKDIYVDDVETPDIQALINEWSVSLTRKTIQNRIGFLMSVLNYVDCDRKFKLKYPKNHKEKVVAPDIDELHIIIQAAKESFRPLIALAAFGSLRRGEVCALKQKDILRDMNSVYIHADMIQTDDGIIYKDHPKTDDSTRTVQLPKFIIDMLPVSDDPEAFVFNYTLNMVTSDFGRISRKCGFNYSFHSLRHFAASFRSDLGIPQKYIEELGGWKDDSSVMRDVYDNTLNSSRKKYIRMANEFIEKNFMEDFEKRKDA